MILWLNYFISARLPVSLKLVEEMDAIATPPSSWIIVSKEHVLEPFLIVRASAIKMPSFAAFR